ncbi:response regulator transcription factor [Cohnella phaseoli]|uniref:Two-component system response regulator YesN n=1 Tax=Cohnella phaseoli TaxID=456490 RepID=A0A3D9KEF7_9BACL|nr:response regulator [Cohnella phaseoli]RED83916.1 two-component system response regulator YesN [Cohnella phaseoli]
MKIMVVDDEPIVPQALRALIPWEEHGFTWLPPAENGAEALELIERDRPDLLLLDCRMPGLTGLELLEEINARGLPIKSVILSGHDEFVYAQQAIKLGALDYLLKPPDLDQLLHVVLSVKQSWEEERKLKHQLTDHLPMVRFRFLTSLLEGARFNEELFEEKTGFLQIPLRVGPIYLAIVDLEEDPDDPKNYSYEDQQLMNFAVLNVSEETLAAWPHKFMICPGHNRFVLLVNVADADKRKFRNDLRALADNLRTTLRYSAMIGVSAHGSSLNTEGKSLYQSAKTALEYKYYTGPGEVVFVEDLEWENVVAPDLELPASAPVDEALQLALKIGSPEQLDAWLGDFILHLKSSDYPVQVTKSIAVKHMVTAADSLATMHPKLTLDDLLPPPQISLFFAAATLDQLAGELRRYLDGLLRRTLDLRKDGKNAVVEKTKLFIAERFRDNITLETAAQEVHMSPVYLSFLFKQVEGVNLSDYLTETRLGEAKRLLATTSLKTYEVAVRAGYADEKYFSRLFKKRTGLTPTEYRNREA